jgi:hypothetical protein
LQGEAGNFLGYFVWKITILRQKIIFFPILGACAPPPLNPPLTWYNHLDSVRFLNRDTKSKNVQHWQLGTMYTFVFLQLVICMTLSKRYPKNQKSESKYANCSKYIHIKIGRKYVSTFRSTSIGAKLITLSHILLQYIRFYMSNNSWK